MEIIEADCLCLRAIDYRDNDKLITLYGSGIGKLTATAKGCKSSKAKLKYAVSPLCFGRYYFSRTADRYVLTGCDCYDSFFGLTADVEKYYCACVVLELLDKTTPPGEEQNELYVQTLRFLTKLCYEQTNAKQELFAYLIRAIQLLGYECRAIRLSDIARWFRTQLDTPLNSLDELLKLL